MRALDRKLLRDLARMKGQVAAVALVIAAGVMTLMISVTSYDALAYTQQRFYAGTHFADVFADLKRAPEGVAERLRTIAGVSRVDTRVQAPVWLAVAGYDGPIRGILLSLPDGRQPLLNQLHLREGRLPEPGRADQAVVSDAFAEAHGLRPGDALTAIVDGRLIRLTIAGVALSAEFIYQAAPSDLLPDYRRYAIVWMNRRALARAYGMDGAFNSVLIALQGGADEPAVIDAVEHVLRPHGLVLAHGRHDQQSHRFLSEELNQLRVQAVILPTVFMLVSAFLLNVVMSRIIRTQREQVAVLKAFGYTDGEVALHYALLTGLIVLLGWAVGVALGVSAAQWLLGVYAEYFRFPAIELRLQVWPALLALVVAVAAGMLGTGRAVWRAVTRPPAEAMRPEPPARFNKGWVDAALGRWLDSPTRIIVRNLARQRFKSVLSVSGIAMSAGLLMMGAYQLDAVDHMLDTQYRLVQRMDVHLAFSQVRPQRAVGELRHQPGVLAVEAYRSVPVRIIAGHRRYQTALLGMEREPQLRQLLDSRGQPQRLPDEGLVVTRYLADDLGLTVGAPVEIEVLEGARRIVTVPLVGVVDEPIGVGAYMARPALNRILREGPAVSGAWLLIEREREAELFASLGALPAVASIGMIADAEQGIRDYMDDTLLAYAMVFLLLAGSIAFAVVYNNARITFAERARELATLEVLGYTRAEVSWVLLGEIAVLTLLAIPLGWAIGWGFCWALNLAFNIDLFRLPLVVTPRAHALAATGIVLASVLAGLLMLRRLGSLDKVSVLKAVE